MWRSRAVYETTAGSYSKVTELEALGRQAAWPATSRVSHVITVPWRTVFPSVI